MEELCRSLLFRPARYGDIIRVISIVDHASTFQFKQRASCAATPEGALLPGFWVCLARGAARFWRPMKGCIRDP